jgi:hypothetical protein
MKKYLFALLFVFILYDIIQPPQVYAESATGTPTQINARIMPLIWYSTLSINEGDSIKVYAAIQNNSGVSFTGNAVFYVDDKEILKKTFISADDTLIDVYADWVANVGSHGVQVKITAILPTNKELVSYESDKSKVSITRKITAEVVQEVTRNTITNIVNKIDEIASSSANKVEGLKKPVAGNSVGANINVTSSGNTGTVKIVSSASQIPKGAVLGTSTRLVSDSNSNSSGWWARIYNWLIDALVFLIKHWLWVLIGLVVIYFGWKVKQWGDK